MTLALSALGAVAGAIVGSFLATLCIRWSRGEQATSGRSACDHCGKMLGPAELIPLLSALANRGRCRGCGGAIARLHPAIELLAAAIGAIALLLSPDVSGAALALFGWLLIAPAVLDARHHWLPDRLTFILAAAGLLLGHYLGAASLADRLIGAVAGFAILEALRLGYRGVRKRNGLGGGDPKLLAAIGLWLGWAALPFVLLLAAGSGLAAALVLRLGRDARLPFGTALAAAAWLAAAALVLR